MVKKPSLSIHIELSLYILSPTTNIEELSSLSFISENLSSLDLVSLGSKGKGAKGKINLLMRLCLFKLVTPLFL